MAASTKSPDELRKQAPNWSLEGDGKLLEYMESISKTLDQKCNETLTNINKMLLSIDETSVALGNTTNKLLALQHSQFVENRVYDEDETTISGSRDSNSNTNGDVNGNSVKKSNGEVLTPIAALQLAIDNGLNMLSECYEKVSLDLDDSDDENDDDDGGITNIVFHPKDPYIDKPLPFIIGSKEWKEKWHVGLLESDMESDNENEVEQFSDTSSSNPSLSASIPSNAPTVSESEGSVWGLNTTAAVTPSNSKSHKDLFNNSSSDDDDRDVNRNVNLFDPNDVISKHNQIKKSQPDEEVKEKTVPAQLPVVQPQQSIFREQQGTRKIVNIFDDEPPELDNASTSSSSLSKRVPSATQTSNRPIKPVNLFDESDDENNDDIFLTNKSRHTTAVSVTKPSVNLFNDTPPDDEFKDVAKKETKPAKMVTNLFDDDNDDDDIGIVTVAKPPAPTVRSKITNLFDDDIPDDDLDLFIESKKSKTKLTASSSSSSVSESKPNISSKITKLFDDDVVEDDFSTMFSKPKVTPAPKEQVPKEVVKVVPPPKEEPPKKIVKPVVNLFANDDDDDEEEEPINPVPVPAVRTVKAPISKPKTINLFSEDDNLDDDFSSLLSNKKETPVQPSVKSTPTNLFEEDENNNDFPITPAKPPQTIKQQSPSPINTDSDEYSSTASTKPHEAPNQLRQDTIYKSPSLVEESEKLKVAVVKKITPSKLFDDDNDFEDNGDEFYPEQIKKPEPPAKSDDSMPTAVEEVKPEEPKPEVKIDIGPSKSFSLFSDEPPEDDFDELFSKNSSSSPSTLGTNKPELPPLDDDNEDEDWLVSSTKSSNIFDKFNDQQQETTPQLQQQKSEPKSSITTSALQFSSVQLFDDIPPPDDDLPELPPVLSSSSSSKSHIYYDDTDTFNTADVNLNQGGSGYVINDIPPVDDYQESANKDEPDRSALSNNNFKDKLNVFKNNNDNNISGSSSSDNDKKIKPQPKKLNTNMLSINVGALMPGAKRPTLSQMKRTSTTSSDDNTSSAEEKINTSPKYSGAATTPVTNIPGNSDTNILQSLNKSRAKIQVKRRPSTRQGRQETYRKSMVDDSNENAEQSKSNTLPVSKSEPISITQALLNLRNDSVNDAGPSKSEKENVVTKMPKFAADAHEEVESKPNKLFDNANAGEPFKIPEVPQPTQNSDTVTKLPKKISLFDGDGDVEPAIKPQLLATSKEEVESSPKKSLSLFEDDSGSVPFKIPEVPKIAELPKKLSLFNDDDITEPFKISSLTKPVQNAEKLPELPKKNSLFDDDELVIPKPVTKKVVEPPKQTGEHEVKKEPKEVTHVANNIEPIKFSGDTQSMAKNEIAKPSKKFSLFDDDEDDDLFSTKTSKSSVQPVKPQPPPVKVPSDIILFDDEDDLFANVPAPSKENRKIAPKQKQPLFSSDEDNDLFANSVSTTKKMEPQVGSQQQQPSQKPKMTNPPPPQKTITSSKNLFDSDDDDDDLFGASSKTKITTSGKKSISQSLLFAKSTANNKLFDDSDADNDNDDDIFKSKFVSSSSRGLSSTSHKKNGAGNKNDRKTIKPTEIIDSDPLADLLK